jgi:hypothetical protein
MRGFSIGDVEVYGSAPTVLERWFFGRWVVRMAGGWNWFRIVSSGEI